VKSHGRAFSKHSHVPLEACCSLQRVVSASVLPRTGRTQAAEPWEPSNLVLMSFAVPCVVYRVSTTSEMDSPATLQSIMSNVDRELPKSTLLLRFLQGYQDRGAESNAPCVRVCISSPCTNLNQSLMVISYEIHGTWDSLCNNRSVFRGSFVIAAHGSVTKRLEAHQTKSIHGSQQPSP